MKRMGKAGGYVIRSAFLVAVAAVLAYTSVAAAASPEQFDRLLRIPRLAEPVSSPEGDHLSNPRGVAARASDGHVFVADLLNARIDEFTSWGTFVQAWGWGVVRSGPDNDPQNEIQEATVSATGGTFRFVFTPGAQFGSESSQPIAFNATATTVDSALEEMESLGPDSVIVTGPAGGPWAIEFVGDLADTDTGQLKIDTAGLNPGATAEVETVQGGAKFEICVAAAGDVCGIGQLGDPRTGQFDSPGQFAAPLGIAVDSTGSIYAVDTYFEGEAGARVQKFSPSGEFLLMIGGEVNKTTKANLCTKADLEAGDECGIGVLGSGDGQFANKGLRDYIDTGSDGTLYVGDVGRIQEFNPDGTFKGEIELEGAMSGKTVEALTVGPDGSIYIVLSGEDEVRKLSPSGGSLTPSFPVSGPTGVAVDIEGFVYVTTSQDSVVVFDSSGAIVKSAADHFAEAPEGGVLTGGIATNVLGDEGGDATKAGDLYISNLGSSGGKILSYVEAFGPLPKFEPAPQVPPTISGQFASSVQNGSATVVAAINPHFFEGTTYYVEYGTGKCSEGECPNTVPAPPGTPLGAQRDEPTLTDGLILPDLSPGITYHYRFVAISGSFTTKGLGEGTDGAEGTFTIGLGPGGRADDRGFELVSPSEKNSGEVPGGPVGLSVAPLQASPSGDAITYTSFTAFGPDPQSSPAASQYLSRRGTSAWETENITPADEESYLTDPLRGFSEDLSKAAVIQLEPPLLPGAPEGFENLYVRDNGPAGPSLRLITDIAPTISFPRISYCVTFVGASDDFSHVIFAANGALTAKSPVPATANEVNLYEWTEAGGIQLVSVAPKGTPIQPKNIIGFGGGSPCGGITSTTPIQDNAVSADGSKIFFTANGALYARVEGVETVQLDLKQGGPGPAGGGKFWGASADGSKVFFTDQNQLTPAGKAISTDPGDLYRYDFDQPLGSRLIDISASSAGKGTVGVVGLSEDGDSAYFVSEGLLAGNEGPTGESAEAGEPNLYLWQAGEGTRFIATLSDVSVQVGGKDSLNWIDRPLAHTARVSPDGGSLAFVSGEPLTGFDNTDQSSGKTDTQVFLYDAEGDALRCASCNPTGARPAGSSTVPGWNVPNSPPGYLSDAGNRLFFESLDAIDEEDTNGQRDVYEFELDGTGSCTAQSPTFVAASGGCVYLISTGKSTDESKFADASSSGDDVFFSTRERLVGQDIDERFDVYDARVGGGFPPPAPEAEPCQGEACRPASPSAPPVISPAPPQPGGNVKPKKPTVRKCPKGKHKVKKKGKVRCVKNRKHSKSRRTGR